MSEGLLDWIAEVSGVQTAVIGGLDGLMIDGRGDRGGFDLLAAFGAQLLTVGNRLSPAEDDGLSSVTAEWRDQVVVARRLTDQTNLVVALRRKSNAAYVMHLVDRN